MKHVQLVLSLVLAPLLIAGCGDSDGGEPKIEKVRKAAVAGAFYPGEKEALSKAVDGLLARTKSANLPNVRALICPHAGYQYSGLTAAVGYKQLVGRDLTTAVVLAPSHTAAFAGASVPEVDAYETPLGLVVLSPEAKRLAARKPFTTNPAARVQQPQWAQPLAEGETPTPHTWEHSLEVHLPFLQKVLKDFKLVPAVLGQVDPAAAAKALAPLLNDKTIVIASTDLSHGKPYDEAREMDAACVSAILKLDMTGIGPDSACGRAPVLTVMHLARARGWKTMLLDYRNSGDTAGDKRAVVGYAAIAFYEPAAVAAVKAEFSAAERKALLDLARKTVTAAVTNKPLPALDAKTLPEKFRPARGCFVTLNKKGQLRGCVGYIFPYKPLGQAVIDNAVNAALRDTRFKPVAPEELKDIEIEISILTVPAELKFSSPKDLLAKLRPNVDGVVLKFAQGRQSTYLPQVWGQIPGKEQFLSSLSVKAGMPKDAWTQPGLTVLTYQAEVFHESGT
jgi:MEMO1 family protein